MTIVQLFNLVVATACMLPKGLEEELHSALYKDCDPEKASNYRGIAQGSCVVKVLAKLLLTL